MPRRSLAQARRVLEEDVIPRTSDYWAAEYRRILETAEASARQRADRYIGEQEREVRELRDEALRELSTCRDELEDLHREGQAGQLETDVFTEELHNLRQRQRQAEAMLEEAEQLVTQLEEVERDPIGWHDALAQRMPNANVHVEVPW